MPNQVVLYSRQRCHLCDEVKTALTRLARHARFEWREVDIDSDPELQQRFNDEVPVVFINGRKAFKYHMDEAEFLKKLKT